MHSFQETSDLSIHFSNLRLIDSKRSEIQKIFLYKHPSLGKILIINNEVQHVEKWAPLYHEMIVHLPIASIPEIQRILILGGGSLFAAAEILKYESLKKIVLVDHDASVIDVITRNYAHAKKVLNDKRFELRIKDAFNEVKQNNDTYDLIINDSTDLIKQGRLLKLNLIKLLCTRLNTNGICSDVVYRHIFERKTTLKTLNILKEKFQSTFSLIAIPEYPGIFHVLCLWSNFNKHLNSNTLINKVQKEWLTRKHIPCDYYNPQFLNYYKYFPNYLNKILKNI